MKSKKLLLTALTALGFASGLTACGEDKGLVIGILQPIEHVALNADMEGFKAGLAEKMGDVKYTIDYRNAGGSDADLKMLAKTLVDDCDMTFGIGTDSAMALKNASVAKGSTKPVLFSAVTDPISANLLTNETAPEGFVTGSSDMNPVAAQIELIKEIIPDIKKIGIMYTQTEINSQVQCNMAKAKAEEMGISIIEKTILNTSEISTTAQALTDEGAEAIYLPTDNKIAASMSTIKTYANQKHILVMCGEEGMIKSGGHVSLSIDYTELGRLTGIMAADILLGNKTVAQTPVKYMALSELKFVYSSKNMNDAGITLSDALMTSHTWVDVDA